MKTLRNFLLLPLLVLSMAAVIAVGVIADQGPHPAIAQSHPGDTQANAPEFAAISEGSTVAFAWTGVEGAESYRLLLYFGNEGEGSVPHKIDVGKETEFVLDFGDKEAIEAFGHNEGIQDIKQFDARVEACDKEGVCRESEWAHVSLSGPQRTPQASLIAKMAEKQLSRDGFSNSCDLFYVEPGRSCLFGTDIFVPVGGSNPFTASGGTSGFTCISNDPSIVGGTFPTPDSGIGEIIGISPGSTVISISDGQGCSTDLTVRVVPADGDYIYLSDMFPAPYPFTNLIAGEYTEFSVRLFFPPISGRYVRLNGIFGNLDSPGRSEAQAAKQIVFSDVKKLDRSAEASSWSMPLTFSGIIPYGYDFLIIWFEYLAPDETTILALSGQTGWLIDQLVF